MKRMDIENKIIQIKKGLEIFKGSTDGVPIMEFIGLRGKM